MGHLKTSIRGKQNKKNRWEEVECEMIKEQLKFYIIIMIMQTLNLCKETLIFQKEERL